MFLLRGIHEDIDSVWYPLAARTSWIDLGGRVWWRFDFAVVDIGSAADVILFHFPRIRRELNLFGNLAGILHRRRLRIGTRDASVLGRYVGLVLLLREVVAGVGYDSVVGHRRTGIGADARRGIDADAVG